ncbi:MAG: hypothetical protein P4L66_10690 [Acetobacteraceae bacterium]|nr:hypothetical protein [Acetobacteraceae bacterium]
MSNGPFSFSKREKITNISNFLSGSQNFSTHIGKAILGEYGWIFLTNDTNDFFEYQFGKLKWNAADKNRSESIILDRISAISSQGVPYIKFIVPEKSVIYSEYLPSAIQGDAENQMRPAKIMSELFRNNVYYMENFLKDAKSYGFIYFRGDSHTSWLGSYFVYRYIAELLFSRNLILTPPIDIKYLEPSLAGYDGDLYSQLGDVQKKLLENTWGFLLPENTFETTIKYTLKIHSNSSTQIQNNFNEQFPSIERDVIVYENIDTSLPKAVIFRDSTLEFCHELIAQHFSRCVFIWHNGAVIDNFINIEKPDVVIHVMAERFVSAYPKFEPISSIG